MDSRISLKLRFLALPVALLFSNVANRTYSQDSIERKLSGASRTLTGPVRALGSPATNLKLPKTIALRHSGGEIQIEMLDQKATPDDAIAFSRSYEGETWIVGGSDSDAAGVSRGVNGNAPANEVVSVAAASISLDQLMGQNVFRGKSFVTPAPNAKLLSGAVTIRRAVDGETKLTADTVEILSGNETVLSFTFPSGQDQISWSKIPDVPADIQAGLKPGEYAIRFEGQTSTAFTVEDEEIVDWIREPMDDLADRVGEGTALHLVYCVEYLLSQLDDEGRPSPYYCDAIDLIDSVAQKTDFTQSRRSMILSALGQETVPAVATSPTGIAEIDSLRAMIQAGQWAKAKDTAQKLMESADQRTAGLAELYMAVVLGESTIASVYLDDPAANAFESAITKIGETNAADAFRAHTNFANYLTSKVQSRIYNYALQSATKLQNPLRTSLWQWNEARKHYKKADGFVSRLSTNDQAANAINQARHYIVMGDFVRNLQTQGAQSRTLLKTADAKAKTFASKTVKLAKQGQDHVTCAAALEVLAHIAYRNGTMDEAKQLATDALESYGKAGSLAGMESCHRTLGLIASRTTNSAAKAINHFEITLQISELLRDQIELNESGAERAGFFARYAYTNERLIDLLVQRGEVTRAFEVAEMAKARSFQDMLSQHHAGQNDNDAQFLTLQETLDQWPDDTCAIEFYVGSRYVYAFCVLPSGDVTAQRLNDVDGKLLSASDLVGRVSTFLSSMELRAQKMYREAISGRGFDKAWQNKLHQFYQELVPDEAKASIKNCKHVVIVPHHVLHYFPFAALVTELDKADRGKMELPQPTFLVESDIDITVAPSLLTYAHLVDSPSEVDTANAVGIADFENAPRLAGVETDLKNYQDVFGDAVGVIVKKKPITEPDIAAVFNKAGILLIGTHGQNEADRPLTSFLLCDSDDEHDGKLTALELFKLPVAADVVVLSACYSGLADRSPLPGDDLFGLQRAILQSGAKSIVSGLWDVYDDTAPELVKSTMTHFNSGKSISGSLANAQRDFLKKRREAGPGDPWIHPYFWSVYTCNGGGHSTIAAK